MMTRPLCALVVEDGLIDQGFYEMAVEELGGECVCVNDADKVMSAFREGTYDIVLFDLDLPKWVPEGKDGIKRGKEVYLELRGEAKVPIIVVTGVDDTPKGRRALDEMKPDHLVSKPCSVEHLQKAIRTALGWV